MIWPCGTNFGRRGGANPSPRVTDSRTLTTRSLVYANRKIDTSSFATRNYQVLVGVRSHLAQNGRWRLQVLGHFAVAFPRIVWMCDTSDDPPLLSPSHLIIKSSELSEWARCDSLATPLGTLLWESGLGLVISYTVLGILWVWLLFGYNPLPNFLLWFCFFVFPCVTRNFLCF